MESIYSTNPNVLALVQYDLRLARILILAYDSYPVENFIFIARQVSRLSLSLKKVILHLVELHIIEYKT